MARIVRERGSSLVLERQQLVSGRAEHRAMSLGVRRVAAHAGEQILQQLDAPSSREAAASLRRDENVHEGVDVAGGQAGVSVGHDAEAGGAEPVAQGPTRSARRHGKVQKNGTVVTSVALDEETYGEIWRRAERDGTSFAEQIRLLIEWGLMADEESGR